MSFISRISLYNSSLFRINKGVANAIQKLYKTDYSKHPQKNDIPKKNMLKTGKYPMDGIPTKLQKVNLALIVKNAENLPKGLLTATFQKLCFIYHENKHRPYFLKQVNFFSNSKVFYDFCQVLEKNLPKFQPSYLIGLLDLIHFNVPLKSAIMRKIFVLILDNMHYFPAVDLLELYCQLQEEPFRDEPECKSVLQACENYFENHLEEELSHYYNLKVMSYFIAEKNLPLKCLKILTEKCLNLINLNHYNLSNIPLFFLTAFEEPILSFYKTELLEAFKLILKTHKLPRVQEIFSNVYKKLVLQNDEVYDEEICKMLIDNFGFLFSDKSFVNVISNLCKLGYYDQNSVEKALDLLMGADAKRFGANTFLNLVSIYAETNIHEMSNPHWSKIKSTLESVDAKEGFVNLSQLFQWCELLTFLGCDTTSLLSQIFDAAVKITNTSENSRSLLRLHHVCKKYFPESGLGLTEELVKNYLQKSVYPRDFYTQSHVHKFFGGQDCVVENCISTDCHFLPIVVVLGPDNKPIDLSTYNSKESQEMTHNFSVMVNIDHIEKPPGSKVIAFVEYPSSRPFKFRNAPITSRFLQMFLKPYEGLNCNIVPLSQRYFLLTDDEKSKYLSTEVNKIIESSDTTSIRNEI